MDNVNYITINKKEKCYEIDYNKVESLEDVKNILKCLHIRVAPGYMNFESLKPYLVEVE